MSDADPILVERDGPIATVILNRPSKLNALTKAMWGQLGVAISALSAADGIRCIVVRGAGERAFSPGNDIGEFATERANKAQAIAYGAAMHETARTMASCRHPLVPQIMASAWAAGLEIAACDLGSAARRAVSAHRSKLGLVMATPRWRRWSLVGRAVTLEVARGRILDAADAQAKGLVTRVVPDGEVAAEASATAQRIAEGAPLVARWHKKFAHRLADPRPLTTAEQDECFDCFDTEDFRAGYAAFLAKTKPEFRGR
jgi:enoyl-CoA hydratase/carnithine racemase